MRNNIKHSLVLTFFLSFILTAEAQENSLLLGIFTGENV